MFQFIFGSTILAKAALSLLEISTCVLFLIGGLTFCKVVKPFSVRGTWITLAGTIFCFIGGLPNAADKTHWVFGADTPFDSSWMFAFVGIGYVLLATGCYIAFKKNKSRRVVACCSVLFVLMQMLPKSVKMSGMLLATGGMICFYVFAFLLSKEYLKKLSILYFVPLVMTLGLVVFEAAFEFTDVWPNMLAQTCNNVSYATLIALNCKLTRIISENSQN